VLIYPAVDLRNGVCVRLMQGRFDQATVYDLDPFARLAAFEASGARWAHIVDLDGAKAGRPAQHRLIGRLAGASRLRIQAGGGVRAREDVERLLNLGVSRVVVGSAAVSRPDEVRGWISDFGRDRICLALDVRAGGAGFEVAVHGWQTGAGVDLFDVLSAYPDSVLRHLLVTDVARDGALTGPNLDLIRKLVARRPEVQLQASGGVAQRADLRTLAKSGASGAIVGRALYEGRFTLEEAISDAG
jgi:phosphoribosylformimino-5-aminoimidazole carboxamide ribotide isomerase